MTEIDREIQRRARVAYVVCHECGEEHGNRPEGHPQASTWHLGKCDICKKKKPITEFRDYGFCKYPYPETRF